MAGARLNVRWANGCGIRVDPQKAHDALEKIRAANGGSLTTEAVIEAASERDHVLHGTVFDLPVEEAAFEHYKSNARKVVRSLIYSPPERPSLEVRVYDVTKEVPSEKRGRRTSIYGTVEDALSDPEARQYVLRRALVEAISWRNRYEGLAELADAFVAIDELSETLV